MPEISPPAKVLVTGANGFIAIWLVRDLLEHGYSVRGAVRSARKAEHLHKIFAEHGSRFESVAVEDITKEGAFDEALDGIDAIAHMASPVTFSADDPNELIQPAVDGTLSILNSALKYAPNLKRFVYCSSVGAIAHPTDPGLIDESRWNETAVKEVEEKGRNAASTLKYQASKVLAERAAWAFHKQHNPSWSLTCLHPSFVYGPILHEVPSHEGRLLKSADLNETMALFTSAVFPTTRLAKPGSETHQGGWVDVRDVARGFVLALEKTDEEVAGKRVLLAAGVSVWQDYYDIVNSLATPGVSSPIGTPGSGNDVKYFKSYDTSKSRNLLGLTYRRKSEMVKDIVQSLQEHGFDFEGKCA